MSAKPWEIFLASLCFDQPLEPWPSIGISTGKNPISKSAQLHFRMDKLRFANFQKIDVLIPVPHLHSRFGICGIQCYCERSHSFTCVISCEQHAGQRDTVKIGRTFTGHCHGHCNYRMPPEAKLKASLTHTQKHPQHKLPS